MSPELPDGALPPVVGLDGLSPELPEGALAAPCGELSIFFECFLVVVVDELLSSLEPVEEPVDPAVSLPVVPVPVEVVSLVLPVLVEDDEPRSSAPEELDEPEPPIAPEEVMSRLFTWSASPDPE